MVAYTLLAMAEQPMTLEQLRDSANALLEKAGLDEIDFDTEDAIVEVSKLGLLNREGDMLMGVSDLQPLQQAVSLAEFQDKVVVKCVSCFSCNTDGFQLIQVRNACF